MLPEYAWLIGKVIGVILATVMLLVAGCAVYIAHKRKKYSHLPTPPYTSFFMGHAAEYFSALKVARQQDIYREWAEKCGPVFVIFFFQTCLVISTGPAMVKELLTKSKHPKWKTGYESMGYIFGERFLGQGLFLEVDHEKWHRKHNVISPSFHKKYLSLFLDQFNAIGNRWIESLNEVADGKTAVSMHQHFCRVAVDAISEVGFDDQLESVERKDSAFLDAITTCMQGIAVQLTNPFAKYSPRSAKFVKSIRDSAQLLRTHGQELIDKRRAVMKSGEPYPGDILTHIIKCREMDPSLTDEDLLDDYVTLFFAGHETTAGTLSFMLCEVGKRPEILQKLRDEIDEVVGCRNEITFEDLRKLEYCGHVFKETLRMYPVVSATTRINVDEFECDGYRIPAGSVHMVQFYAIHHLRSNYENPEEFIPERFSGGEQRPLYTYVPFSVGQRACIGQQFAKIEAKVLMCKFFQNYDFNLDMNQSFGPALYTESVTLRPKDGAMVTLTHR